MNKKARILYISYNGMTESLGQSQVLAYLTRLSDLGYEFDIIAYEKKEDLKNEDYVKKLISSKNINWIPLEYSNSVPIFSTLKDLYIGWKEIRRLYKKNYYDIVHCRSYIPAILGLKCKQVFGSKFLFDMRGWWPDEKKESGLWDNILFTPVYKYFKKLEREFFAVSDCTISLTYAGKEEIVNKKYKAAENVAIIPTCVDFEIFKSFDTNVRNEIRNELNIPSGAKVLLYSGALGTNYDNEGIIKLYKIYKEKNEDLYFLILAKDSAEYALQECKKYNVSTENVRVVSASFKDVYKYLIAGDVGIILYKKQFSSIGRSPTKLGEYWACGLPMISIKGLGDLDKIIAAYPKGGILLYAINENEVCPVLDELFIYSENKNELRKYALEYFDISVGVTKYNEIYEKLITNSFV
jgi:glycosyltransferase involved in cell wall biosynthesis